MKINAPAAILCLVLSLGVAAWLVWLGGFKDQPVSEWVVIERGTNNRLIEVPTNAIHLMPHDGPHYVMVCGSSNRVSAGGSYSIVLGSNIEVTNEFEFAFGGFGSSLICRTRMSIDEFIMLRNVMSRAIPDGGTVAIDSRHMGKDEFGRPRLHYTTNMPQAR